MFESDISHLFEYSVTSIARVGGGGNSRVFQVKDVEGRRYALKSYPPLELDQRDRIGTEYTALNLLSRNTEVRVPRPISIDRKNLLAVYEWIDGDRPAPTKEIIDAMLDFIRALHLVRKTPDAQTMPLASECCLSGADILRQVQTRIERLKQQLNEPRLQEFLLMRVEPMLADFVYADVPLPAEHLCLTPGDFGSHNMLVEGEEFVFLDMEYFGWDDPAKQVCDVIWHPGMNLSDELISRFLAGARIIYAPTDSGFIDRVKSFFPAYGLRWITILLNEFLPERWALRAHAGASNLGAVKVKQLKKAEELFLKISERKTLINALLK